LDNWEASLPRFVKVFPRDLKAVLAQKAALSVPALVEDKPTAIVSVQAANILDIEDSMKDVALSRIERPDKGDE
jgi:hypothetical protein